MEPPVSGELRMKGRDEQVVLLRSGCATVVENGQDLHPIRTNDLRRPDKHGVEGLPAERLHVEVGLEAIDLTPKGVASDTDVHQMESIDLRVVASFGKKNCPGARTPDRHTALGAGDDGLAQVPPSEQAAQRGALAAGDDQGVCAFKVYRKPYLDNVDTDVL
jgi:hypothetical protein